MDEGIAGELVPPNLGKKQLTSTEDFYVAQLGGHGTPKLSHCTKGNVDVVLCEGNWLRHHLPEGQNSTLVIRRKYSVVEMKGNGFLLSMLQNRTPTRLLK